MTKDPYLWLEQRHGKRALAWVNRANQRTTQALVETDLYQELTTCYQKNTLPQALPPIPTTYKKTAGYEWRFKKNAWQRRRTHGKNRKWVTLLNINTLNKQENSNWVFSGAKLSPNAKRALLWLSDGHSNRLTLREFDLRSRTFAKDGFSLPMGYGMAVWWDDNTLLANSPEDPQTTDGYPTRLRYWQRGEAYQNAHIIYEIGANQGYLQLAITGCDPKSWPRFILTHCGDQEGDVQLFGLHADPRHPHPVAAPQNCEFLECIPKLGAILVKVRADMPAGRGRTVPKESVLVVYPDRQEWELLWHPRHTNQMANAYIVADKTVCLHVQTPAGEKLLFLKHGRCGWKRRFAQLPHNVALEAQEFTGDNFTVTARGLLTPTTLYDVNVNTMKAKPVAAVKDAFPHNQVTHQRLWATSRDGTRVPYLVVCPKDIQMDGQNPTLLYGYGGFGASQGLDYLGVRGKLWFNKGGVFVISQGRGGSELGATWHTSAQKTNRQKAFDDFIAVAEDLIARGYTTPKRLGIMGASNGGLLTATVLHQRPELFGAVISSYPLTDMLRFTQIPIGHWWVGEYGTPDDPVERAALAAYSPYHRVQAGRSYPPVLLLTATNDDRVHPAHARKLAARLKAQNHPVWFYEFKSGGHSNTDQTVMRQYIVLMMAFLFQHLGTRND